jgi:hypothetical protein
VKPTTTTTTTVKPTTTTVPSSTTTAKPPTTAAPEIGEARSVTRQTADPAAVPAEVRFTG